MKPQLRKQVYDKYGGRCAYCGQPIEYKDMQIDHVFPQWRGGKDDIENLNPSCRLCNHYKGGDSLDCFRTWKLAGVIERLKKVYIFRVALRFGMITINEWDKNFYFEKIKK